MAMEGPFGPATQLLAEIRYELADLSALMREAQPHGYPSTELALPTTLEVLPAPVIVEPGEPPVVDLNPLLLAIEQLSRPQPTVDPTPALIAVLAELTGLRTDLAQFVETSRRSEQAKGMFGIGASTVTVGNTVPVQNVPGESLNVSVVGQTNRSLAERMFARAPQVNFSLWMDTADSTYIYLAEAPSADVGTASTFQGIRVTKDGSGNPLGKVQTATGFIWNNRSTTTWT